MNPTDLTSLVGRLAFYRGKSRTWYMDADRAYEIIAERRHPSTDQVTAVCFENDEWVAVGSIELVEEKAVHPTCGTWLGDSDLDKIFEQAAGGPREMITNEIIRLEARLIELRSALKVIDSL